MKTYLNKAFACAIVMATFHNCSVEPADTLLLENNINANDTVSQSTTCSGDNPKARIINNGTIPFDYQIFDSTGTLIAEISNIAPGTNSGWTTFPEGTIIFNVENDTVEDQKVFHLMENCMEINLEIDGNNLLTNSQPQAASN